MTCGWDTNWGYWLYYC